MRLAKWIGMRAMLDLCSLLGKVMPQLSSGLGNRSIPPLAPAGAYSTVRHERSEHQQSDGVVSGVANNGSLSDRDDDAGARSGDRRESRSTREERPGFADGRR